MRQLLGGDDASPVGLPAVYYPLVGLALGAAMVAIDGVATSFVSPPWPSVVVVTFYTIATRARPLLGLARTIGLSLAPKGIGDTAALTAILAALLLTLSVYVVAALDGARAVALCFAPMLGRCAMVVIATGSREARDDERQVKFSRELTFREFGIASTFTFAVVFSTTHFLGLLLVLATGFLTIGLRLLVHWARGGVDRASLHACGEVVQLAVLGIVAAF